MIEKIVKYPYWGEHTIHYDSFVYKVVDEDENKVLQEQWAKTPSEYFTLRVLFEEKEKTVLAPEHKLNKMHTDCFEYLIFANDELGAIKIKNSKRGKSKHRILVYIQGFLSEKQN